jgi:hypothetical protein
MRESEGSSPSSMRRVSFSADVRTSPELGARNVIQRFAASVQMRGCRAPARSQRDEGAVTDGGRPLPSLNLVFPVNQP